MGETSLGIDHGWAQVDGSEVWHYFEGRRALCARVALPGAPPGGYVPDRPKQQHVCQRCDRLAAEGTFFSQRWR